MNLRGKKILLFSRHGAHCINSFTDPFTRVENPIAGDWAQTQGVGSTSWAADGANAALTGPEAGPSRIMTALLYKFILCHANAQITATIQDVPADDGGANYDWLDLFLRADAPAPPTAAYIGQYRLNSTTTAHKLWVFHYGVGLLAEKLSTMAGTLATMSFTANGTSLTVAVTGDGGPGDNDSLNTADATISAAGYAGLRGNISLDHAAGSQAWDIASVTMEII